MSSNAPEPEFLDQGSRAPRKRRTKAFVLGGVAALAVGAVGVGAWGFAQLMGGGPGAATALPSDTLVYAAIDLDPSAEQKIEAFKTMRKFPALDEELGLNSKDDLRSWFVEQLTSEGDCDGLDYGRDVEPWIGEKAAFAMVESQDEAQPVFALQVSDEEKAQRGVATIAERCSEGERLGTTYRDGYLIVAESNKVASDVASRAEDANLADDAGYQDALESLGEQGIVTVYVAKEGPAAFLDSAGGELGGGAAEESLRELKSLQDELEDFDGAAGTLRFDDGGVELAVVGTGLPQDLAVSAGTTTVPDLPETTVAVLGFALPEGWVDRLEEQVRSSVGEGKAYDDALAMAEAATGLQLPEDLELLFGRGVVLALDGQTDFDSVFQGAFQQLKAGIRVEAEEADVRRIVTALQTLMGLPPGQELVKIEAGSDRVAIGFDQDYLAQLVDGGDLGEGDAFSRAVPEAERAGFVSFVDFDAADDWLVRVVDAAGDGDDEATANVRPLDALGLSAWSEGEESHFLLRLSTD